MSKPYCECSPDNQKAVGAEAVVDDWLKIKLVRQVLELVDEITYKSSRGSRGSCDTRHASIM